MAVAAGFLHVLCLGDAQRRVAYPILRFSPGSYLTAYLAGTIVDSALEFGVLVELVWSVLRPYWTSLPRRALLAVCLLIIALGAAIWPFAGIAGFGSLLPNGISCCVCSKPRPF